MKCPICKANTKVIETASTDDAVYRKRMCERNRYHIIHTVERVTTDTETIGKLRYKRAKHHE